MIYAFNLLLSFVDFKYNMQDFKYQITSNEISQMTLFEFLLYIYNLIVKSKNSVYYIKLLIKKYIGSIIYLG